MRPSPALCMRVCVMLCVGGWARARVACEFVCACSKEAAHPGGKALARQALRLRARTPESGLCAYMRERERVRER